MVADRMKQCYHPCLDINNAKITPHNTNKALHELLRDGRSAADLDLSSLTSIRCKIPLLENEVLSRGQEVNLLKSLLSNLQSELDNTQRDLDNHKSIFAPIRRLPDDLLLRIFKFASHGISDQLSSPLHAPWALLRVCTSWRNIALNSPTLWSVLAFNFTGANRKVHPPQYRVLFRRALELSKNSNLNIQLTIHHPTSEDVDFLWKHIISTSSRWVTCDLSSDYWDFQEFLDVFRNIPNLRTLRLTAGHGIDAYTWFGDTHGEPTQFFSSAAALRTVEFYGLEFLSLSLPLHQLTELSIHQPSRAGASSLFHQCIDRAVNLNTFSFHCKSEMIFDPLPNTVIHARLQKLKFVDSVPASLFWCSMPGLEELVLFTDPTESHHPIYDNDLGDLCSFVERSNCPLQRLEIRKPIPFSIFKSILLCCSTSLTDLALTIDWDDTVEELTNRSLLPSLRTLSLSYLPRLSKVLFEDDSIDSMARARRDAGLERLTLSMPQSRFWVHGDTPNRLARLWCLITSSFHIRFMYVGTDHFYEEESLEYLINWVKEETSLEGRDTGVEHH